MGGSVYFPSKICKQGKVKTHLSLIKGGLLKEIQKHCTDGQGNWRQRNLVRQYLNVFVQGTVLFMPN